MTTATILRHPAVDCLDSLPTDPPQLPASRSARVNALRAAALAHLDGLALPTLRDEAWRFTDLSPLKRLSFQPVQSATRLDAAAIAHFYLEDAPIRLVFVDGLYAPQLSSQVTNAGVAVTSLSAFAAEHAAAIKTQMGRHQSTRDNLFAARNTAFMRDAAVIVVRRNVALAAPVHLLFIATQAGVVSYPRCLLVAEAGSSVTLIEDYVALQDAAYLINPVTEIALAEQAHVKHVRVQRDSQQAFHIANCAVSAGPASHYQSVSVAVGGQISRYNLDVQLAEGAECAVDGLTLIADSQLADTHTAIDHTRPHATSRQLHKCIVGGSAHAVFNGKVMVRQGAQRTDSVQSSRNLLLTAQAHVDTKPQLEIFADDVKCAHGATIGQLDNDEVFYLKSRGLSDSVARNLLTCAFGAEIIDRIPIASLKHRLGLKMLEQCGNLR
jgi:Fe-S cluster assembly protein SufD